MKILIKDKCSECNGDGVVTHYAWVEFYKEEDAYKKEHGKYRDFEMKDVEEWFRQRGFYTLPPEEPTCHECEGSGEIQKWMEVSELIKILNPYEL